MEEPSHNHVWMTPLSHQMDGWIQPFESHPHDIILPISHHPHTAIRSQIGGMGYLTSHDIHPICQACHHRMVCYVQLRLSDMPKEAALGYALSGIPVERQLFQCR